MTDKRLSPTGWTPNVSKPATKAQLISLRDKLLEWDHQDGAAAADNLIDLLTSSGEIKETPLACPRCNGSGRTWQFYRNRNVIIICPLCSGLGHITEETSPKCPRCNGKKEIFTPDYQNLGGTFEDCPICSGLGYITEEAEAQRPSSVPDIYSRWLDAEAEYAKDKSVENRRKAWQAWIEMRKAVYGRKPRLYFNHMDGL